MNRYGNGRSNSWLPRRWYLVGLDNFGAVKLTSQFLLAGKSIRWKRLKQGLELIQILRCQYNLWFAVHISLIKSLQWRNQAKRALVVSPVFYLKARSFRSP